MTENLQHPNYDELMGFVVEVYREMVRPGSSLKKMTALQLVGSPAPNSFEQAMIEVSEKDGGFGLSHMPAKEFFNNDLPMRQQWADHIAAVYDAYKAALTEAEAAEKRIDPIVKELEEIKARLAKFEEAAKQGASTTNEKAPDEAESEEEDAAETAEDEAAEGDDAAAAAKAKKQ